MRSGFFSFFPPFFFFSHYMVYFSTMRLVLIYRLDNGISVIFVAVAYSAANSITYSQPSDSDENQPDGGALIRNGR